MATEKVMPISRRFDFQLSESGLRHLLTTPFSRKGYPYIIPASPKEESLIRGLGELSPHFGNLYYVSFVAKRNPIDNSYIISRFATEVEPVENERLDLIATYDKPTDLVTAEAVKSGLFEDAFERLISAMTHNPEESSLIGTAVKIPWAIRGAIANELGLPLDSSPKDIERAVIAKINIGASLYS